MRSRVLAFALAAVTLIAASMPVMAHHSFSAEFDSSKNVTLTGTITNVKWQNPHIYFYIDVKDPATGKVTNYGCEMGSPNGVLGNGLSRNALRVGMVVSLNGSLAKNGTPTVNARTVTVDGKPYNAASSESVTP